MVNSVHFMNLLATFSVTFCILLFVFVRDAILLNNGQALTPPMGWLAWEVFQCNIDCTKEPDNCISEKLFKSIAEEMVAGGYSAAGYDRINIDDCWMSKERIDGKLAADKDRFPQGIPHLVKYMHDRGLKLGIYGSMGKTTCMNFAGSYGHLKVDAETFAEWDVDMIKMDGCLMAAKDLGPSYKQFGKMLNRTLTKNAKGHKTKGVLYSCSWPYYMIHYTKLIPNFEEIAQTCHLMRSYHDIKAHWGSLLNTIDFTGDNQEILFKHVRPGFWNDPDMLLIGNAGLTEDQAKAQFGIWSLFPAPLLMSNDLRSIDDKFKKILLNREVIKVNQDKLGLPGRRIFHNETLDVWVRELSPDSDDSTPSYAIGVLNRKATNEPLKVRLKLSELKLKEGSYQFRDILEQSDFNYNQKSSGPFLELSVPPTALRLLRATPINMKLTL